MVNTEEQAIWKPYPEFPFIEANQFGEIRTRDRIAKGKDGKKYHIKGRVLKQQLDRYGYLTVHIRENGNSFYRKVHRIVATSHLPNPNNLPEVNHKDNDRTNNRLDNLEWCTTQYNTVYREKYGKSAKEATRVLRKPVIAVNLETSEVFWFESQIKAGRQLGIDDSNVNAVVKGRYSKTHGYWFCYADEKAVEKTRAKFGDEVAREVEKMMNCN